MSPSLLEAALRYAGRGWAVFPCHQPALSGVGCSCHRPDCASPAKHPHTRRGLHDATTNPEIIHAWWRRWPTANVAIRTGAASGLVVLDVDPGHGGLATLAELQRRHGILPPSPAVRTGSGGRHYWFVHPGGHVANSAGRLGPGLDIRGDGGYVIAPPSVHGSGTPYLWASEVAFAPVPDWLLSLNRERTPDLAQNTGRARHTTGHPRAWAAAAIDGELDRVRKSVEGSRNHTLNRAAFALGQLVGGNQLDPEVVEEALVTAGIDVGLTPREVRATVASGLRAGTAVPRSPSIRRLTSGSKRDGANVGTP